MWLWNWSMKCIDLEIMKINSLVVMDHLTIVLMINSSHLNEMLNKITNNILNAGTFLVCLKRNEKNEITCIMMWSVRNWTMSFAIQKRLRKKTTTTTTYIWKNKIIYTWMTASYYNQMKTKRSTLTNHSNLWISMYS